LVIILAIVTVAVEEDAHLRRGMRYPWEGEESCTTVPTNKKE
jgi:hypothetical protein